MGPTVDQDDSSRTLARRAGAGDRLAFDALAAKHGRGLLAFIEKRMSAPLRRAVDPEDVLQETLTRAFQSLERFEWRGTDSFGRWLCRIAEHVILGFARKHLKTERVDFPLEVPGTASSPSTGLRREERFERLEEALEGLSPDQREVILLTRIQGLPVSEVAKRLNRSPKAVYQLIWRALENLRRRFGDTGSFRLPDRRLGGGGGEVAGGGEEGRPGREET